MPAARGNIYDRYGRPVAVNNQAFTVNFDPSSNVTDLNVALYNFILLMEKNNEI